MTSLDSLTDVELAALTARVNYETALINLRISRAVAIGEQPPADHNDYYAQKLTEELQRRHLL